MREQHKMAMLHQGGEVAEKEDLEHRVHLRATRPGTGHQGLRTVSNLFPPSHAGSS